MFGTVAAAGTEVFDVGKIVNKDEDGREVVAGGIFVL